MSLPVRTVGRALIGVIACLASACTTPGALAPSGSDRKPVDATPYWSGPTPCSIADAIRLERLPLGAPRVSLDGDGRQTFRLPSGIRVVIEPPQVTTYPVSGSSYSLAYANMLWREGPEADEDGDGRIFMARVHPRFRLDADTVDSRTAGPGRFTYDRDGLEAVMSSHFTFPEWVDADRAPPQDRILWEKALCAFIHHELAHVLIELQGYEERLPGLLELRAPYSGALQAEAETLLAGMAELSEKRHQAYHRILDQGGSAVMEARPYLSYDWPWLARTVGQGP